MSEPNTHLQGITWDHPRGYDPLIGASAEYEAQTGVRVSWQKRSLQAFGDEPLGALAEKFDVLVIDHPHVGQVAETGALAPLSMAISQSVETVGRSAESYIWKDQCWAYAIDAACQMSVHRGDYFGPLPIYWEDFLCSTGSVCRPLTALKPIDAFDLWLTLCASLNARMPLTARQFVNDEAGLYGLKILKALYSLGPSEAIDYNPINVLEILADSDEFVYSPGLFGYINYAKPSFRKTQLHYGNIPVFRSSPRRASILGGAGIAVSAKRDNIDTASAYAAWLASEAVQKGVYLKNNGQPATRDCWQEMSSDHRYSRFFDGAYATMQDAWTRPRDVWFLGFVDDVCDALPSFFAKGQSPESFLSSLNAMYQSHRAKEVEHA